MNDILKYIPQRPPFVLVDRILSCGEKEAVLEWDIHSDSPLVDDGILFECGLLEHMAQSAAARIGYLHTKAGKEVSVGFLATAEKFVLNFLPKVGDTLRTRVCFLQEVGNLSLASAETTFNGMLVASCRMKIILEA